MRRGVLALTVSNLASKPFGLLRQLAFATFYGVTAIMSACRFAQTITLAFMNFFTTDTLNAGFLPLYQRYKKESSELAQCFFCCLFALILLLSLSISCLLLFGADWIVHVFAPGFKGQVVQQSVQFIHIFALAVPFCLLGTLLSYLAMSDEAYVGVALRPIFESSGLIAGVMVSVWLNIFQAIAWGFVLAYILFFIFVAFICLKRGLLVFISMPVLKQHAARLALAFWQTVRPLLVLPFFMQGKFVAEKMVASLIAVSAVASLDYARFIVETGISIMAVPIGLVGLATFSVLDGKQLQQKLEPIMSLLLLLSLPLTVFLMLNAKTVISVLYGYGAFDQAAIQQASLILSGMSFAFFAQVMAYVMVKVLSSRLQNRRVMYYMGTALLLNIAFIVAFYASLGPLVLGLGESLYALTVFIFCARYLQLGAMLARLFFKLALLALPYAAFAYYLIQRQQSSPWIDLFEQLMLLAAYWSGVFFSLPKTRAIMMRAV